MLYFLSISSIVSHSFNTCDVNHINLHQLMRVFVFKIQRVALTNQVGVSIKVVSVCTVTNRLSVKVNFGHKNQHFSSANVHEVSC
jgi:hypothetical protein